MQKGLYYRNIEGIHLDFASIELIGEAESEVQALRRASMDDGHKDVCMAALNFRHE